MWLVIAVGKIKRRNGSFSVHQRNEEKKRKQFIVSKGNRKKKKKVGETEKACGCICTNV